MQRFVQTKDTRPNVFEDFALVLNRAQNCLTEIAIAEKGGSHFNRAIYFDDVDSKILEDFSRQECNVAFLADCSKDKLEVPLNRIVFRQAKNESIFSKSIISFDIDFKNTDQRFLSLSSKEKFNFAILIAEKLIHKVHENNIPVWIVNFSGNGLHLHFKLEKPIHVVSPHDFRSRYQLWADILTLILGSTFKFDESCSDAARLMRLPLSVNWKDRNDPIENVIFLHEPTADASTFFCDYHDNRKSLTSRRTTASFIQILNQFNYNKMDTLSQRGDEIVCSSPFTQDRKPSFYFNTKKNVYYDFSTGKGGGLNSLIESLSMLANDKFVDAKKNLNLIESENANPFFSLRHDGVWFNKSVNDTEAGLWLCAPLTVNAMTRSHRNDSWGRVLSFNDNDGVNKTFAMPMEMIAGDGLELRRELLRRGLHISQNRKARFHLMEYIQSCETSNRVRCVARIGWHNDTFVLPKKLFSTSETKDPIILQKEGDFSSFDTKGSLSDWQNNVAALCAKNPRLIFSLSIAFSPPLLHLLGEESGGFHFFGPSSIGKTLALRVAGSVWGGGALNGFVKKWNSTINGLEALAESRCDSLLVLDEIAEISPREAAVATYMLANGSGKKRMTREQTAAPTAEWRIIFLSSGEISLGNHLLSGGEEYRGGQFVRLVEIEADAGDGFGIFCNLGQFTHPSIFAEALRGNCAKFYGTAIEAFLQNLVEMKDRDSTLNLTVADIIKFLSYESTSGQMLRVAKRFALVATAGVLASKMKILPFDEDEILTSVKSCFDNWAQLHKDFPDFESEKVLSTIRQYLQFYGCAHFPEWDGKSSAFYDGKCCGFRLKRTDGSIEWLILNEVFKNEICKGFDFKKVIRILKNFGVIKLDKSGKSSIRIRLPSFGLTRVYHLTAEILSTPSRSEGA